MSTTQFVRVRFIATGATGTVPENMLAYYVANGYEAITDEEAANTPFPYVRAIGTLAGLVTIEDLLEELGDGIGDVSDAAVAALRAALVGGAPELLNTLDELAAALGDDANFAATVTAALATKQTAAQVTARSVALTIALGG